MEIVRTTTHAYSKTEEDAMMEFYNGKRCVITLSDVAIWAHMLDAALDSSNPRLQWMLQRQLRQNRYPAHAAEVRENLIPLDPTEHCLIDLHRPRAALFLHEDIVARTLQFERELKEWRIAEVQAGRGDPRRPGYGYVFLTAEGTMPPTLHRWHASIHYRGIFRTPDGTNSTVFRKEQCPGIDPTHADPFPIINTLLSIPFSLLHNLPRLSALLTSSPFRRDLVTMAVEIVSLWAWDPEPLNIPITASSLQRTPMPRPIHDASRNATFASMRPLPLKIAPSTVGLGAPSDSGCVTQSDSGAYVIGASPRVYLQDGALTAIPPEHDTNMEKEPIGPTIAHVAGPSSWNRSASLGLESTPESECGSSNDELEPKLDVVSLQARVAAWLEDLDKEALDPLLADMNDTEPFIPGCMGGMTANDILMVKGLINPSLYIHFYDLSSLA